MNFKSEKSLSSGVGRRPTWGVTLLLGWLVVAVNVQTAHALFVPISGSDTIVAVAGDDFSTGPHALGFNFSFFGTNQTSVFMNSNGNLTFGAGSVTFTNAPFPTGAPPRIAPLWDDLFLPPGQMRINALTPGQFVATWNGVGTFSGVNSITAQAVLLGAGNPYGAADGTVVLSYDTITGTSGAGTATVGLNEGNAVGSATLNPLGIGGADGILSQAQAQGLSNQTFTFTPTGPNTYSVAAGGPQPQAIPEPTTIVLLGLGLGSLVVAYRRRKK